MYPFILFNLWCLRLCSCVRACASIARKERVGRQGRSRQSLGPGGPPHLSLAQKAPHLTPLFLGVSWTEPPRGRCSLGLGRAGAHAHSLSPFFPPQALMTLSNSVGSSFPCRREDVTVWAPCPPHRDGPHSPKCGQLFTSRPDHWPFLHFTSWEVLLCTV